MLRPTSLACLAFVVLAACGPTDPSPVAPRKPAATGAAPVEASPGMATTPAPSYSPVPWPVPAALQGDWVILADAPEPPAGPLPGSCYGHGPQVFDKTAAGIVMNPDSPGSGVLADRDPLEGTYAAGHLQLKSPKGQTIDMAFEPKTDHLTGTWNGKPAWLAPLEPRGTTHPYTMPSCPVVGATASASPAAALP